MPRKQTVTIRKYKLPTKFLLVSRDRMQKASKRQLTKVATCHESPGIS